MASCVVVKNPGDAKRLGHASMVMSVFGIIVGAVVIVIVISSSGTTRDISSFNYIFN